MLTAKDHKMNSKRLEDQIVKLEQLGLNVKVNKLSGNSIDVHVDLIKNLKTFIIIDFDYMESPEGFSDVYLLRMIIKDTEIFTPKLNTEDDFHNAIDKCIDNAEKYMKEL
jgi:hypothetical protein